jgi:hypothetical protein
VGRVVAQSPEPPASQAAPASPKSDPVAIAQPSSGQPAPPRSPLHIYQVVLLSQAAPAEAPPGLKHVRLQNARARDVANVLVVLYLPSGPGGTDHRFTLVYPTPLEAELASEGAREVDVGTAGPEPAGPTAGDAWRWGVAEAFRVLEDPAIAPERVRRAAATLATTISSAQMPALRRWMAGMLAGELLAHRLYDYAGAQDVYRQTESAAEPGSYEQMALVYAQARAFQQDGRRDQARAQLEFILGQFSALRDSEIFERTRESLAEWDRRR